MENEYDRRLARKRKKDIEAGRCRKEDLPQQKVVEEIQDAIDAGNKLKEIEKEIKQQKVYNFNKGKK